jgi:polyisoprenoid-binding protein YceI
MKRLFAVVLTAALPALAVAQTTSWMIDPAHTNSSFAVKHLVISTVSGQFGKTTGTIKIDDKDMSKSIVEATVDVTTIDTRVEARDKDLKSANFFDVEKFPTMTFKSTKVQKVGDDKLKVTGDLTIKGNTKPVTWDVALSSQTVKGFKGETRRGLSATTEINRKDFGLAYSKVVEAGPVVGDQVKITVDAEAVKEEPKAEAKTAEQNKQEKK